MNMYLVPSAALILFILGICVGANGRRSNMGWINGLIAVFSIPFSFVYLIGITAPFWLMSGGANPVFGFAYAYLMVFSLGFWPIPLISLPHAGWVLGECFRSEEPKTN